MVNKDQHGKPLKREFAPGKRPTKDDLHKIVVVPKEPDYEVTVEDQRIKVKEHGKEEEN